MVPAAGGAAEMNWVVVLLIVLVIEGGLILLFLESACRTLERIAEGTDPARIARRYER